MSSVVETVRTSLVAKVALLLVALSVLFGASALAPQASWPGQLGVGEAEAASKQFFDGFGPTPEIATWASEVQLEQYEISTGETCLIQSREDIPRPDLTEDEQWQHRIEAFCAPTDPA